LPAIPEEWSFKAGANNPFAASVVIPAGGPNVRHVLTHVKFTALIAGTGIFQPVLEVIDGAGSVWTWQMYGNAPAGQVDMLEFDNDMLIIGSPAAAMTVHFLTATPAGGVELIQATGHDL
jgi:hypothetical protein